MLPSEMHLQNKGSFCGRHDGSTGSSSAYRYQHSMWTPVPVPAARFPIQLSATARKAVDDDPKLWDPALVRKKQPKLLTSDRLIQPVWPFVK